VRLEQAAIAVWRREMAAAGVPAELLDRTLRMPHRAYELSNHERESLDCKADGIERG
jgi:hypothetical protein